jgi:5-methylcytosine-specific restriction protein A
MGVKLTCCPIVMPSKNRTTPKAGFISHRSDRYPRGPNGRLICRCGCGMEVSPPRRTFFSDNCVHEWRLRSDPGYLRAVVQQRDKGICTECGRDCEALYREVRELQRKSDWKSYKEAIARLNQEGFSLDGYSPQSGRFWQADHIIPVAEGGGECGLDNLRTLCTPCHKKATAALRKRLAAAKRGSEQLNLLGGQ